MSDQGTTALDRVMPHNLEAEQAVLGCAFLSADAAEGILERLAPSDFYRPGHARIFSAMARLAAKGVEVDHLTVAADLETAGELATSGGKPYLIDVTSAVPTSANWSHYARIVERTALLRQVIAAGTDIVALGYDAPDDIDAAIEDAHSMLPQPTGGKGARSVAEIAEAVLPSYATPHEVFDIHEFGIRMRASTVTVVGGKTGTGKSALALHAAVDLASRGIPTRIYSYEMSDEDWTIRCIAREFGVSLEKLEKGIGDSGVDWFRAGLADKPWSPYLKIVDCMYPRLWTLGQLQADMRRFAREGGKVAMIDYLQILQPRQDYKDVTESSTAVRIGARQSRLALLVLSQVSKTDMDGRPRRIVQGDLRGSGTISQDADDIIILNRTDAEEVEKLKKAGYLMSDPAHFGKRPVDLTFTKRRRGSDDFCVPYWFDGSEQRFTAIDRLDDDKPAF